MRTSCMALAVALACSCLLALATASDVDAEASYKHKKHYERRDHYEKDNYHGSDNDYHHSSTKTITLYAGRASWCPDGVDTPTAGFTSLACTAGGPTVVAVSRDLYLTEAPATAGTAGTAVATLYQTGITAFGGAQANGVARVLYHQSFRFLPGSPFGQGTIQTQGDDTGPADSTYTNRAIIGGTGAFNGASGYLTRGGDVATGGGDTTPTPEWKFVFTTSTSY